MNNEEMKELTDKELKAKQREAKLQALFDELFSTEEKQAFYESQQVVHRDYFGELGFVQQKSWLWVNSEHRLRIERFGYFSGPVFSMIKPYYLFPFGMRSLPDNAIAGGVEEDIVTGFIEFVNREGCL
jgi:hypothetical protein